MDSNDAIGVFGAKLGPHMTSYKNLHLQAIACQGLWLVLSPSKRQMLWK